MKIEKQQPQESLIAEIIVKYKPYWPVFLLLSLFFISMAFVYIEWAQPKFRATASLIIKDEKKGYEDPSLMESLNLMRSKKIIENEIEVLQSTQNIESIIKELKLYIPIYEQKGWKKRRIYESSPFVMESALPDQLKDSPKELKLKINASADSVEIDAKYAGKTGEWLNTKYGPLKLTITNKEFIFDNNSIYTFHIQSVKTTAKHVLETVKVKSANKLSSVVELEYKDMTPDLAKDVLNQIINRYNEDAILEKNVAAKNAIQFIEDRLSVIGADLTDIERKIEQYKANTGAVDISKQGQLFLETVRDNDKKLSDINLQMSVMDDLSNQLSANTYISGIQSSVLGNIDPVLNQLLASLNNTELDRERLKKTVAVNNPLLISVSDQISKIKNDIFNIIQHQRRNLEAAKKNISFTNANYNGMLYAIPVKERELLELSRDQEIKSGIYSFLLQKREESELSFASNIADSRVINKASSSDLPVAPNSYLVYAIAVFSIIGLPIGFIGAKETLASSVLFRTEIERLTKIPIIGEISYHKKSSPLAVEVGKRSFVAEEFRRLRYALQYYLNDSSNKKILVTSSISGEGKSFISANLAISFSMTGKKVALVDFDLHQSSLGKIFDSVHKRGVSDYLSGNMAIADLPIKIGQYENLYFITSGKSDNDPSETIDGKKTEDLLKYLDQNFDVVIIDCSPLALVTDANYLSKFCSTTIYVVRHGYSPKYILQRLDENNVVNPLSNPVIIFSGIRNRGFFRNRNSYGYGYSYTEGQRRLRS